MTEASIVRGIATSPASTARRGLIASGRLNLLEPLAIGMVGARNASAAADFLRLFGRHVPPARSPCT